MEVIDAASVSARLPMKACIAALREAMAAFSEGRIAAPQRTTMPLIDKSGTLYVMPGSAAAPLIYGAKILSVHPANPEAGRPALQGVVLVFDPETGAPRAVLDGAEITGIRTAAMSGLATDLLARTDASTLGLIGYGVQARTHLEAMCAVRPIAEVRVWGRSPEKARAFAAAEAKGRSIPIVAVDDARDAAACDIICTVTSAHAPVLFGADVKPGAHVNIVGAHSPMTREADTALMAAARVYVDVMEAALHEAGEILLPIAEGAFARDHVIGEIGALVAGKIAGRTGADEITAFKSVGHVAQDLAAAHAALSG